MKLIPNAVSAKTARFAVVASKNSPQTLFAAGIVGMGATVVLACRATLKVETILDKAEESLSTVEQVLVEKKDIEVNGSLVYTEKDARKDKAIIYIRMSTDLVRLYAPAVVVGGLSVAALAGSHNILSKRNAALTAAYGVLEKSFDGYRERVREAYGEKREEELYNDVQICEIDDPETGKVSKKKVAGGTTPYSFLFDEFNKNWEPTPEYNFMFLKMQQQWANDRLHARGHLFLNEVLEQLGLDHTMAGAVTGWVKGQGDNYVDFGIFEGRNEDRIVEFMIGREKAIWLDFNVDGTIYDKI